MTRLLTVLLVLGLAAAAQAQTHVASGGDLQAAINAASGGDTITLEAGATWTGNYTLPAHAGAAITVRTVTADGPLGTGFAGQTAATVAARVSTLEPLMATIRSTNTTSALRNTGAPNDWTFIGIIFEASNAITNSSINILTLGDNTITDANDLPENITIDRCIIRAVSGGSAQRGLQMQVKNMIVRKSFFGNIRSAGAESGTMGAWNSPGPFLIEDNYIEAASIGVLFGGAKSAIADNVQSDITFRRNYVTRNTAWQSDTGYNIKNLFELKNAQRVTITGNIFEHNWVDAQSGLAIVFTVRANSATAPWTTIQDVLFEHNIVRNTSAAFNILGLDDFQTVPPDVDPSVRMDDVVIRNNLIYGVDRDLWDSPTGTIGAGPFAQINGGPQNLQFIRNTFAGNVTGNMVFVSGVSVPGFVFTGNCMQKQTQAAGFPYDTFGFFGNAVGEGNVALNTYMPHVDGFNDVVFTDNVLAGATASAYNSYPTGNTFPTVAALIADYTNPGAGNYRLPGSYSGQCADQDAIEAAIAGETPGTKIRLRFRS